MERGYVQTRLGQIYFVADGAGEPYVLLSAAGRSSRMFADLIPLLSGRFRVVAIDTPGFGRSDPLPNGARIEDIAESFLQLLDRLGCEQSRIYGLHTGNKIGTAMVVQNPARFSSFVLAGQSHSLIPEREARNAAILNIVSHLLEDEEQPGDPAAIWAAHFKRLVELWWSAPLSASAEDGRRRALTTRCVMDELEAEGTSALYRANLSYDLGANMRRIAVPTLILEIATPEEDRVIGRQSADVQRLIPGASVAVIHEPRGRSLTLENRAADLAAILLDHADARADGGISAIHQGHKVVGEEQ